jgi:hypothetical protein
MLFVRVLKFLLSLLITQVNMFYDNNYLIACIGVTVNTTLDNCLLAVHVNE